MQVLVIEWRNAKGNFAGYTLHKDQQSAVRYCAGLETARKLGNFAENFNHPAEGWGVTVTATTVCVKESGSAARLLRRSKNVGLVKEAKKTSLKDAFAELEASKVFGETVVPYRQNKPQETKAVAALSL